MSEVRFLHNVVGAPSVSIFVGEHEMTTNLSYGELTNYLETQDIKSRIQVKVGGEVIAKKSFLFRRDEAYTVIIGGSSEKLNIFVYEDRDECANAGTSELRFIHNVFGAPPVDIYLENKKFFSDVKYGEATKFKEVKLGPKEPNSKSPNTRSVEVFVAGTETKVLGPVPLYLISGGLYTLFALGNLSGNVVVDGKLSYDNQDRCMMSCETLQDDFDIQKYMGKWNLIASIPQFYDKGCERQTAEYTFLSDKVKVFNSCLDKKGNVVRTVTGSAVPKSYCQPAALIVTFPEQPYEPSFANYLVHKTDYTKYAIVGSPTRDAFYILSRKPKMSRENYNQFLRYAKKLGYDPKLIVPSYHAVADA